MSFELQKIPQEPLSEDDIKHVALSCLRSFYKYYPRAGSTEVRLNQRAEGDIIADGYLSFTQEDGSSFTATFEATSLAKRKEVLFRLQKELLVLDSIAVASFLGMLAMVWEHLFANNYWVPRYGWYASVLITLAGLFLLAFFFFLILRVRRRYRYIYAIEQFKRYHANHQWIAVAERIFPDKEDKYYQELRHQCVYNGVGLIIVNEKGEPHIKAAPAQVDLFRERRKLLQFISTEEWSKRMRLDRERPKGLMKYLPKSPISFDPDKLKLTRFRRFYGYQVFIALVSLVILFAVLFREYEKEKNFTVVDREVHREEMAELRLYPYPFLGPDTIDILDTPYVRSIPFDRKAQPYDLDNSDFLQPGLIILSDEGLFEEYACETIHDLYLTKYALNAGTYSSLDRAKEVTRRLNRRGVTASVLWKGCFDQGNDYLVFLGQLYLDREQALTDLQEVRRKVRQLGYVPEVNVIKIEFGDF